MGKSPDFNITCLHKGSQDRNNNLGVAWKQEDGSLRLKLNPGVVLSYDPDILIALFPNNRPLSAPKRAKPVPDSADNDIPF